MTDLPDLYRRHFADCQRERAFLSAVGFTSAFAAARGITHAIRAGVGPFHNISEGGTHIHHSTFGIFGLLGIGYLWTYRVGHRPHGEWASRITATTYGIASALTLDEFALWLDLNDDYWDKQGRKSIDAVAIFAGLLTIGVAGRAALQELGLLPALGGHEWDVTSSGPMLRTGQHSRIRVGGRAEFPGKFAGFPGPGVRSARSESSWSSAGSPGATTLRQRWLTRPTSATSRSSPTSTTASRRWPTASSS